MYTYSEFCGFKRADFKFEDRDALIVFPKEPEPQGRWMMKMEYFGAFPALECDLLKNGTLKKGEGFNVTVPTGNFGNILAAYYAKKMGIPVKKLICASNANNVLTDFLKEGVYDRNRSFFTTARIEPAKFCQTEYNAPGTVAWARFGK